MYRSATALILIGFALVAFFLYLPAYCLHEVTGDSAETMAIDWLEDHAETAERWATRALTDPAVEPGDAPPCEEIRRFKGAVAYTLEAGGFMTPAKGVCWSKTDPSNQPNTGTSHRNRPLQQKKSSFSEPQPMSPPLLSGRGPPSGTGFRARLRKNCWTCSGMI